MRPILKLHSALVTGCSRGIGLEMVKQFARLKPAPVHIFATCRKPDDATGLQGIAAQHSNVHILKLDVADQEQYPGLVQQVDDILQGRGLTALINNAGSLRTPRESLDNVTWDCMLEEYKTNTVAPLMLTKALLPALKRASGASSEAGLSFSKSGILNMTSSYASIAGNTKGMRYAYRASKVALNMVTKSLAVDLTKDGILVVCVHPGRVKTMMTGLHGRITTEESVLGMLKIMAEVNEKKTGLFLHWRNGEPFSW